MRNIRVTMLAPLLCFLLCLAASVGCSASQAAEVHPRTIQIQLEQWNSLKEKTNLLEARLSLASDILTTQKLTSTELLTQLAEAKQQLSRTQEALTDSKRSLASAKESLKRSNELYEKLTNQMEQERKKARRIRYQRDMYGGLTIVAIIFAFSK